MKKLVADRLLLFAVAVALSTVGLVSKELLPLTGRYLRALAGWLDPLPPDPLRSALSCRDAQKLIGAPAQAPQTMYLYSPIRKRDPFQNQSVKQTGLGRGSVNPGRVKTPLEKWGLDQFRLSLTVTRTANPMAMVEDPDHRGWPVRIGDFIGQNGGKVTGIHRGEIVVTETITDPSTGRVYPQNVKLVVPPAWKEDQENGKPNPIIDVPPSYKFEPRFDLRQQSHPASGA